MSIPNRQIGWSQESNLLSYISKQLDKLNGVVAATAAGGMLNPSTDYIPYNSGLAFGDSFLVNDATNSILKTVYSASDVGLKLDFVNGVYSFGDFNDQFGQGISLFIEDYNGIIKTKADSNDIGLKLDFANNIYSFGDFGNVGPYGNKIDLNANDGSIKLFTTDSYCTLHTKLEEITIGDCESQFNLTFLKIDDFNQRWEMSNNLTEATAGGSASKYLKVYINGVDYKIALLNNA